MVLPRSQKAKVAVEGKEMPKTSQPFDQNPQQEEE